MSPAAPSPTRADAIATMRSLRSDLLSGLDAETVALDELHGRVLATAIEAERDVPTHSRATMDGFAVAVSEAGDAAVGADVTEETDAEASEELAADAEEETSNEGGLVVRDDPVSPGDDPPDHEPSTARRVATGGPIPRGADAVIPVEDATVDHGTLYPPAVRPGQHVVERGDVVAAGETVLEAGRRLAPRDAAVLRDLGYDEVPVRHRLSAAILATGTEIQAGEAPDRDSDVLANLVRAWGGVAALAGSEPDDATRVGDRIASLAETHDVVLTTGGTGASAADETGGVLGDRADVRVENVAMRPGSKVTVAWLAEEGAVLVALPGPPGAAFASATTLVRPLFVDRQRYPAIDATVNADLAVPDRSMEFVVPVELREQDEETETDADTTSGDDPTGSGDSAPLAVPLGHRESSVVLYGDQYRPHRVASCARLSAADGLLFTETDLEAGSSVAVVPYEAVET